MEIRRVAIAYNSIAGRGAGRTLSAAIKAKLEAAGTEAGLFDSVESLASEPEKPDLLLLAGGDGTLQRFLPFLIDAQVPVYNVPAGNESLFASFHGMKADAACIMGAIQRGAVIESKVALFNGTPFSLMASAGLDSLVIANIAKRRKTPIGHYGYIRPLLEEFCRYKAPLLSLLVDGKRVLEKESGYLIVANNSGYARNLKLVPEADTCGSLAARFFPYRSAFSFLKWIPSALSNGKVSLKGTSLWIAKKFEIKIEPSSFPMQTDGEFSGPAYGKICLSEKKLLVLRP